MITKNKIFKYLETQDQRKSPQFNYNKVDTFREMQKQQWFWQHFYDLIMQWILLIIERNLMKPSEH